MESKTILTKWKQRLKEFVELNISPMFPDLANVCERIEEDIYDHYLQEKYDETQIWGMDFLCVESLKKGGSTSSSKNNGVLIGMLTNTNKTIKQHFYLRQGDNYILCHMIALNPVLKDALVLIPRWQIVMETTNSASRSGYIEVLLDPKVIYTQPQPITDLFTNNNHANGKLAECTGIVKYCIQLGTAENMKFVIVLPGTKRLKNIMLSGKECAFWSNCAKPGSKVKLTCLEYGKIKINKDFVYVFTNTKKSVLECLLPSPYISNSLHSLSINELTTLISKNISHAKEYNQCPCHPVMPMYVGEVDSILNPELGIYELNGGVFLHCSYTQCTDFNLGIRPGCLLMIQRAHMYKHMAVGLVCCNRSSIHVIKHSDSDKAWTRTRLSSNSLVLKEDFFNIHPCNLTAINEIAQDIAINVPCLQDHEFTFHKSSKSTKCNMLFNVLRSDIKATASCLGDSLLLNTNTNSRSQSVFSEPHTCIVQRILHNDPAPIKFCFLPQIIEAISYLSDLFNHEFGEYWLHQTISSNSILDHHNLPSFSRFVMFLNTNLKTGHLQVTDGLYSIDCVIVSQNPTHETETNFKLCLADRYTFVRVMKFVCVREIYYEDEISKIWDYLIIDQSDILVLKRANNTKPVNEEALGCCGADEKFYAKSKAKRAKIDKNISSSKFFFVMNCQSVQTHLDVPTCTARACLLESDDFTEINLRFKDRALKWVPFLQPGSTIKIEEEMDKNCEVVQESCEITHMFTVPINCNIYHIHDYNELPLSFDKAETFWKSTSFNSTQTKHSINFLTTNTSKCKNKIVSVYGQVISRNYYMDQIRHGKTLCSRLELKDLHTDDSVTVYCNDMLRHNTFACIIPGAIVDIYHVKVNCSRKNVTYCKLLRSSQFRLNEFREAKRDDTLTSSDVDEATALIDAMDSVMSFQSNSTEDVKISVLDLYDSLQKWGTSATVKVHGNISKVFKLKLSFKCKCCNHPPFSSRHQDLSCAKMMIDENNKIQFSNISMKFMAKCVFDDGTGTVYLYFDESKLTEFCRMVGYSFPLLEEIKEVVCRSQSGTLYQSSGGAADEHRNLVSTIGGILMQGLNMEKHEPCDLLICVRMSDIRNVDSSTEDFLLRPRQGIGHLKIDEDRVIKTLYVNVLNSNFVKFCK